MNSHSWVIKREGGEELESSSAFLQFFYASNATTGGIDPVYTICQTALRAKWAAPPTAGFTLLFVCFIDTISVSLSLLLSWISGAEDMTTTLL